MKRLCQSDAKILCNRKEMFLFCATHTVHLWNTSSDKQPYQEITPFALHVLCCHEGGLYVCVKDGEEVYCREGPNGTGGVGLAILCVPVGPQHVISIAIFLSVLLHIW